MEIFNSLPWVPAMHPALLFQWITVFDGSTFRWRLLSFQRPTSFWIRTLFPCASYVNMLVPIPAVLHESASNQAKSSAWPRVWAELGKATGAVLPGPHPLLIWWTLCRAGGEHAALLKFQHSSASTLWPFCMQRHNGDRFFLPREQLSNKKLESLVVVFIPMQLFLFLSWNKVAVIAFFFAGGIWNTEINYGEPGCLLSE